MSFVASSRFVPYSKFMKITESPSLEVDVISFRLATELRASSTGRVIFVSISDALVPGYVVTTPTNGSSISGYRSTGSCVSEYRPITISPTKIRMVVTGLLTEVLYMLILFLLYYLLHYLKLVPVQKFRLSFRHKSAPLAQVI